MDHGYGWIVENGLMESKRNGKAILPVELVDILDTINQHKAVKTGLRNAKYN